MVEEPRYTQLLTENIQGPQGNLHLLKLKRDTKDMR